MGVLIQSGNWSQTPLGSIESWPQSLKTTVGIILQSQLPMAVLWGSEGIIIYNDAFSVLADKKHPSLLGKKVFEGWPEIVDFNQNAMDEVLNGNKLSFNKKSMRHRNGAPEGTTVSLNYSPVLGENATPAGALLVAIETTSRIIEKRQMDPLQNSTEEPQVTGSQEHILSKAENWFHGLLMQAPAFIAVMRGPAHVFEFANTRYMQLVGEDRDIIGKTLVEAIPEVKEQGFIELLDEVYTSGEPFIGNEIPVELENGADGKLDKRYVNFVYQPFKDSNGNIQGVFAHGIDVTEQVISRQKIAQKEEKYRTLFESMDQGFCIIEVIFDAEGVPVNHRFLEINPVFEKQTGFKDAVGKTALELEPDLEKRWFEIYGNVASTGRDIRFIEGSEVMDRWFEVYAFRIGGTESRKVALLFTDISEQKKAEEALKKSENQMRLITDALPAFIAYVDPDKRYLYVNSIYEKWFGLPKEHIIGRRTREIIGEEAYRRSKPLLEKVLSGEAVTYEGLFSKEGQDRYIEIEYVPDLSEDGSVKGFVVLGHDITERKKAEEALKESEEFSRTLLESSPDSVKALDLDGRFLLINPQGLKKLQINHISDIRERYWLDFWRGEYYEEAQAALKKARDGEIGHFSGFSQNAKGEGRWWDVLVAPVFGADGKVERLISVSRDITNLKELEQQKDDFISIASHELKTPVTSIKAYAQVLHSRFSKAEDSQSADMLAKMDAQVNKLTNLISDLLDVTKIQQSKMQFRNEHFEFNELVNDIVEEVQRTAQKHHIRQKLDTNTTLIGDRDRIGQVITNFLTNAIKYSPKADKIIVRTRVSDGRLTLSVQDYGLGLSKENQGKVFDRFYRVGGSVYETYPGLGLGLYISSEIIHRHQGDIWVDSENGVGSTFYFSLPLEGGAG